MEFSGTVANPQRGNAIRLFGDPQPKHVPFLIFAKVIEQSVAYLLHSACTT